MLIIIAWNDSYMRTFDFSVCKGKQCMPVGIHFLLVLSTMIDKNKKQKQALIS